MHDRRACDRDTCLRPLTPVVDIQNDPSRRKHVEANTEAVARPHPLPTRPLSIPHFLASIAAATTTTAATKKATTIVNNNVVLQEHHPRKGELCSQQLL